MRRSLSVGGLALVLSGAVGAAGLAFAGGGGADPQESGATHQPGADQGTEQGDDAGIHGGPIDRFHAGGSCDVVGVAGLQGNWTHGDYVTAVGALGDAALINVAAKSECGKPMHSLGHGGGPPAHALEHASKGLEKAEFAREADQKADEA